MVDWEVAKQVVPRFSKFSKTNTTYQSIFEDITFYLL